MILGFHPDRFVRSMALHPAFWRDIGAFDDPRLLRRLRRARHRLGLDADRLQPDWRTASVQMQRGS